MSLMSKITLEKKLSKRERRNQKRTTGAEGLVEKFNFLLRKITPQTNNQKSTFESYDDGQHLLLIGTAGTGKSFLSIYLGMRDIMENQAHEKMIIIRSIVSSRDIGFLPGSVKEKAQVYEAPYYSIFSELFQRGDAYEYLKTKGVVEFMTTSFARGITINNAVIVVDEFQNMNAGELHTIFTRIGKNCKVIFAGDIKQTDLSGRNDASGFNDFFKIIQEMREFDIVEFDRYDVVRSALVKSYIMAREDLEERGTIATI